MKEIHKGVDIFCFTVKLPEGYQPNYKLSVHAGIELVINRECPERYKTEEEALEFAMSRAKCKIDAGLSEDVW
jgi:hypothetical protein